MKRTLILCLFLLIGEMSGNCASTIFPPLQPINGAEKTDYGDNVANLSDPVANQLNDIYSSSAKLEKIERAIFGNSYTNQSIAARLSRLEKSLFSTTYPKSTNTQRIDNIISNFNQINKYPNISANELSKIEATVLHKTYTRNNPEQRIERLEQELLGAIQSGDLKTRYDILKTAASTYNSNPYNQNMDVPDMNYPAPVATRGWKGLARGLRLGGSMTGFTPPINPFDNYSSSYGNNGYNRFSNPLGNQYGSSYPAFPSAYSSGYGTNRGTYGNRGYYNAMQSGGTGMGVTILD